MTESAITLATKHVRDILSLAILHTPEKKALIVSDSNCPLAVTLTKSYQQCLPNAVSMDFDSVTPEMIQEEFSKLAPLDLAILIQSTSFRLNAFRLRVELFERSLKVIEHPHLSRMSEIEQQYYIEALAYDANYYRTVGHALKKKIDGSNKCVLDTGEILNYQSGLEPAKLNIGDYTGMKNIGGQFPIGEVFTEAKDLESVNGRVRIFAFGDTSFSVNKTKHPITLIIDKGRVTGVENSIPEFDKVLENIRTDENEIWVRELGFGMNRAFTKDKTVTDIGTYERMCGIHLSLGSKHSVYKKPQFNRNNTWHHVDVFADTQAVYLDDSQIYKNSEWII